MGGADVIPGVSGGTIAFITGIYETLLKSIKSFDLTALNHLRRFEFKALWLHVNGAFLLTLLAGIFTSILSLAKLIVYLLDQYPIQVWAFFFGLIIISALQVARTVYKWRVKEIFSLLIGIAVAYFITESTPSQSPEGLWFIFIAGAVAICAMILPGISGSFILLLMSKYEYILNALDTVDIPVIIVFGLGCIAGLLSFARVISFLFDKFKTVTIALLAGFMIGSLNKIWPWKRVLEFRTNSAGEQKPFLTENILPTDYLSITGEDPHILGALLFFLLGILIVIGLELAAHYLKRD